MSLSDQFAADTDGAKDESGKASLADQFSTDAAGSSPAVRATSPVLSRSSSNPLAAAGGFASHVLTGLGSSIIGGYRGLATLVAPETMGADPRDDRFTAAAKAVEGEQAARTYVPDQNSGAGSLAKAFGSNYNPLNWPALVGGKIGDTVNDVTGSPALATAADVATQFLGPGKVIKTLKNAKAAAAPAKAATRVEPALAAPDAAEAAAPALPMQPSPTLAPKMGSAPDAVPVGSVAPTSPAPKPVFSEPANGKFAEEAPDQPGGIAPEDQQRRAAILQQIGLDQARKSAITGDSNQAAVDFQTSRLKGSPAGDMMSKTLADEKAALSNYSESIAQKTGGSAMNDQAAKYARGGTILAPLEGLSDWFEQRTKSLYDVAAERAQGVPTQLDNFRSVLGDDSLATNRDRVQMRQAIQSYAKKLNIIRDDGSIFSDGQQAEAMRKYLNENWSPQNAGLVNKLKQSLDEDVMSSAGEDVYGEARKLWGLKKDTIDNPNGISKLLDSSGPNGINRKVDVEKVADTVTNMPVNQLSHIVETLKNVPPELQPQAQSALAEMKAQFAHNVKDIGSKHLGQWNARGVRQYLDNNSKRMGSLFTPEEMADFGTLNDAGNILAKDQSYPGAFAQQQSLLRAGVAHGIQGGLAATGGALAGGPGAFVGNALGGKLAGKINDAATLKAAQKRMVKLSDLTKPSP